MPVPEMSVVLVTLRLMFTGATHAPVVADAMPPSVRSVIGFLKPNATVLSESSDARTRSAPPPRTQFWLSGIVHGSLVNPAYQEQSPTNEVYCAESPPSG